MQALLDDFRVLVNDQSGVTAIEYGLIVGFIAVVIIGSVTSVGTSLSATFRTVAAVLP